MIQHLLEHFLLFYGNRLALLEHVRAVHNHISSSCLDCKMFNSDTAIKISPRQEYGRGQLHLNQLYPLLGHNRSRQRFLRFYGLIPISEGRSGTDVTTQPRNESAPTCLNKKKNEKFEELLSSAFSVYMSEAANAERARTLYGENRISGK